MKKRIDKPWSDVIFFVGITIAVYLGIRYLLPLVIPFLLATVFASLLHPVVHKLENRIKLSKGILSFLVIFIALLVIGIPVALLVIKGVQEISSLALNYKSWKGEIEEIWCMCCERVEQITGIKATNLLSMRSGESGTILTNVQEKVIPFLMNCSIDGIKGIAGFFWKFVVTIIATILLLSDYPRLCRNFLKTQPGRIAVRLGKNTMRAGGTYLKAQMIIWAVVSGVCVIGLLLTGNRYAILAGIGIGICDALPFLGTGIVFVPWLILNLFQGEYGMAVVYGLLYVLCNITREFLEPKLVGRGLGIHPLAVIFSLYVGICVYGGTGIILGPLSVLLIWEMYQIWREYADNIS